MAKIESLNTDIDAKTIDVIYGRVSKVVYYDFGRQLMDRDKEDYVQEIVIHCIKMHDWTWTTIKNKAIDIYRKYLNHEGKCQIYDATEVQENDGYDLSRDETVTCKTLKDKIVRELQIESMDVTDEWQKKEYGVAFKLLEVIMKDITDSKNPMDIQIDIKCQGKKYRAGKLSRLYMNFYFPDYHPMTISEGYKKLQKATEAVLSVNE